MRLLRPTWHDPPVFNNVPDRNRVRRIFFASARLMTIAFENVALSYGDKSVLRDIDLTIPSGQFVCLIGASGCGKTTLLKLINQLHAPTSGRVTIDGTDAGEIPTAGLPARIGYVVQDAGLFPHMTVAENIHLALELAGRKDEGRFADRIDDVLRLVGLDPKQYRDRLPAELSGGQRQRVGIARAVAPEPSILLMDEPFSALDPVTRTQLQEETKRLQQTLGITVVFVTHDMDEAVRLADLIAILEAGRIVQVAAPETIVKHPVNERVAAFVGCDRRGLSPELITAGEIQSDALATVDENATVGDALTAMRRDGVKTAFVLHPDGTPAGQVSYDALQRKWWRRSPVRNEVELCPMTFHESDTVLSVLDSGVLETMRLVPVVDQGGRLTGVLTRDALYSTLARGASAHA